MNSIDIIVLVICILSTLIGLVRGFISSILSTSGWIISIIGNHYLFRNIEPFLDAKFNSKLLTFLVGYVGGLVILLLFFSIINFIISLAVNKLNIGLFDKILGAIFGGIRGMLLVVLMFVSFEIIISTLSGDKITSDKLPNMLLEAKIMPLIQQCSIAMQDYLPKSLQQQGGQINISDITLINIIRKLSANISEKQLAIVNKSIEKNSQYLSKRQLIIARISALWKCYDNNTKISEKLSDEEIAIINSII